MATPRGAEHRDLEQKFRTLEGRLKEVATVAMRRQKMGVSEGDFIVSGGGSVVVQDGGGVLVPNPADDGGVELAPGVFIIRQDIAGEEPNHNRATLSGVSLSMAKYDGDDLHIEDTPATDILPGAVVVSQNTGAGAGAAQFGLAGNGDAEVTSSNSRVRIWHTTTANAANVHMDTDGVIYRSTSSRRYKQDEQPHAIDVDAVLALQPRVFRTRDEVAELGDDAPTHAGFIAEEAAELGLEHWVSRDEDGEPESFAYAQWCVAQQAVLQDQAKQLAEQAATIGRLSARLSARLDAIESGRIR